MFTYDPRVVSRRLGGVALVVAGALALDLPAHAASITVAEFQFDGVIGDPMPPPVNAGADPDLTASFVTSGAGWARTARARGGKGTALDLPGLAASSRGDVAIMEVADTDLTDGDALSPGTADFTLAADLRLDLDSTATDGNNVVQRGLARSSDQYKIQADVVNGRARVECALGKTVDGAWTSVRVTSSRAITSRRWYRAKCRRSGSTLTLVVRTWAADGTARTWSKDEVSGLPVLDLTWPVDGNVAAMTVGGKLRPDGSIPADHDQLNGLVDNVALRIG